MDTDNEAIRVRAYLIWESEGRPHGRHHEHWQQAVAEAGAAPSGRTADASHPGMMGDGTEEQNLGQPGTPGARITEDEVKEAFGSKPK